MRYALCIALTSALCITAFDLASATERVRGNTVAASGCTSFKVPLCTMLNTGRSTYVLVGATPTIPYDVGVTLVGEKGDYNFICGATSLKVRTWKQNRMKCPAPK